MEFSEQHRTWLTERLLGLTEESIGQGITEIEAVVTDHLRRESDALRHIEAKAAELCIMLEPQDLPPRQTNALRLLMARINERTVIE